MAFAIFASVRSFLMHALYCIFLKKRQQLLIFKVIILFAAVIRNAEIISIVMELWIVNG